jgi:hypothetical protein
MIDLSSTEGTSDQGVRLRRGGILIVLAGTRRIPVVLANQEVTIYFTKTHLADLQAIIKADADEPSPDEGALNETS